MLMHDSPAVALAAQHRRAAAATAHRLTIHRSGPGERVDAGGRRVRLRQPDVIVRRVVVVPNRIEIGLDGGADRILAEMRGTVAVEEGGIVAQQCDGTIEICLRECGFEGGEALARGSRRHQLNAWMPVWARPRISACTSCVPS